MVKSKYKYRLPFPKGIKTKAVSDPRVHYGKWKFTIDFPMKENTLILAAKEGTVVDIKQDSNEGGNDPKLAEKANYVTIYHGENEFSQYIHLKHKGALINKGQQVKKGQAIGLSGDTGYLTKSHLHFMVFQTYGRGEEDWESVEIQFE